MHSQSLQITDLNGTAPGTQIFQLVGPLILTNVFGFQTKVREDTSKLLILDFTAVPLIDSAGIGALVGACVSRQKDDRKLALVGVNQRIHNALEITRVENFFTFYSSVAEAEQSAK